MECKTENSDIKQLVVVTQRTARKRRNADMEICNTVQDIKTDETEDTKPSAYPNTSASKKKRIKFDNTEADTKPVTDTKPGPSLKPATRVGALLSKKRLKIEPTAKEKNDNKPAKVSRLMKKNLKTECLLTAEQEERKPMPLQLQRKKKALELLKQRKLAKKVAVVKVEKLRKGSVETKIKEESPVPASASTSNQPKVKLKDKCTICEESFVNKTLLDKHIKSTHIPTVPRYHCVQCNETLKKNMEIKNHNLWHKLSKTPFQCGNCSESSCSIYTYSKHIRDCGQVAYLDTHIPDWHCPDCSAVFETTYLFNIHSCVSNTLICPGCDRAHKWKEDYFKHIPACSAAVHRIPSYMSSNIQVKNEAEPPTSPIPQQHAQPLTNIASAAAQPAPSSRITPPLMDSNQCVVIPGNVNLLEEASSPSSKSGSKKGKRITKKDLKRFDELLKSTMTTLVSIKQEPPPDDAAGESDQSKSPSVRGGSESPPGSPAFGDNDFHHNDDDNDDDSAVEQTSSQPVGTIKQEIIDEGYRDLYNNIEVNIKREVVLNVNRNPEVSTPKKKSDETPDAVTPTEPPIVPKPVLKLKITKEHGTLNSVLLDSPKSEKKKKKKKRKEDKLKAAEREETNAIAQIATDVSQVQDLAEEEPVMPLPGVIRIKEEITEPEEETIEKLSCQSSISIPSIVAATSGSLQISCVSEGVHFNGPDENDAEDEGLTPKAEQKETEFKRENDAPICQELAKEIDIKPRLEDLIPMLRIASVSSGEGSLETITQVLAKKKRQQTSASGKPSTSTPQIVSVSSGSEVIPYQPAPGKSSEDDEEACEKVDRNENIFDYTQIGIKEEVVDPTYYEQFCKAPQEEEIYDEEVEKSDEDVESVITERQAEENAYIANIDFNNFTIKQEKEYIDDGLDNAAAAAFDDDNTSDSDSSSDTDDNDSDSESEREYRELPSDCDESNSIATVAPLDLQILAVHSEFTCPQTDKKTESESGVELKVSSKDTSKSNITTELQNVENAKSIQRESDKATDTNAPNKGLEVEDSADKLAESLENSNEYTKNSIEIDSDFVSMNLSLSASPPYSCATNVLSVAVSSNRNQSPETLADLSQPSSTIIGTINQPSTSSIGDIENLEEDIHQRMPSIPPSKEADSEIVDQRIELHLATRSDDVNRTEDQVQSEKNSIDLGDLLASHADLRTSPVNYINLSCSLETNAGLDNAQTAQEVKELSIGGTEPEPLTFSTKLSDATCPSIDDVRSLTLDVDLSTSRTDSNALSSRIIDSVRTSDVSTLPTETNPCHTPDEPDPLPSVASLYISQLEKETNLLLYPVSTADSNYSPVIDSSLSTRSNPNGSPAETTQNTADSEPTYCTIPPDVDDSSTENHPNQYLHQHPSTETHGVNAVSECKVKNTSSITETSDINNQFPSAMQYVDVLAMSDIDPVVREIDRLIDHSPSSDAVVVPSREAMQTMFRLSDDVNSTIPNPMNLGPSTTKAMNLRTVARDQPERDFQTSATITNYCTSGLSTGMLERDLDLFSSPENAINCHMSSNVTDISSYSAQDQISPTQTKNHTGHDDARLVSSAGGRRDNFIVTKQQVMSAYPPADNVFQSSLQSNNGSPRVVQNTTSHFSLPECYQANTSTAENSNKIRIPVDLSDDLLNSTLQEPVAVFPSELSNQYHQNSNVISETNVSTSELQRFTSEASVDATLNLTELYRTTSPQVNFTELQVNLNASTAGHLHTLITQTDIHCPLLSEMSAISSNSLVTDIGLSVPVLSEDVQNLLNEDAVAANNFELNDSILRARCSTSTNAYSPSPPAAVSVPNFTDLESVNEIAENNNNANIERELQDELGNVLAAAIADRSPNDEVDDNNVMNENRANFDAT